MISAVVPAAAACAATAARSWSAKGGRQQQRHHHPAGGWGGHRVTNPTSKMQALAVAMVRRRQTWPACGFAGQLVQAAQGDAGQRKQKAPGQGQQVGP